MELGHLTRSSLTCPKASLKACHDSFCQLGSSVSILWVVYYEALLITGSIPYLMHLCYLFIYAEYDKALLNFMKNRQLEMPSALKLELRGLFQNQAPIGW
jgi:hypothetical protein